MEGKDIKELKGVIIRFNTNGRYKELLTYIDGLLDRAREEGRKEQAELDRSIYGMSFEEFDKKYKPVSKLNK